MIGNEVFDIIWSYPIFPVSWGFKNFHKYKNELIFEIDPQYSKSVFRIGKEEDKFKIIVNSTEDDSIETLDVEQDELVNTLDKFIFG